MPADDSSQELFDAALEQQRLWRDTRDASYLRSAGKLFAQLASAVPGEVNLPAALEASIALLQAAVYLRDGQLLDDAVEVLDSALAIMPSWGPPGSIPSPIFSDLLVQRGSVLLERHMLRRRLEDLDQAVQDLEAAATSAVGWAEMKIETRLPLDWVFFVYGQALGERSNLILSLDDANESVRLLEHARELTEDPRQRAQYSAGLAVALVRRVGLLEKSAEPNDASEATGDAAVDARVAMLDRAIELSEEAVHDGGDDAFDLPSWLNNLGQHLMDRGLRTGTTSDLDEAIEHRKTAVARGLADDRIQLDHVTSLADSYGARWERTGAPSDRDEALRLYRHVCDEGVVSGHYATLRAARGGARLAGEQGEWREVFHAADAGLSVALQILAGELNDHFKEVWLRKGGIAALAAETAYAAARLGDVEAAVLAIERSRAVILSERFPDVARELDTLEKAGQKHLVATYQSAMAALSEVPFAAHRERHQANVELEAIRGQIRSIAGLERFGGPTSFDHVREAAARQPLVYLIAADHGGLALVVRADGSVTCVWSDALSRAQAGRVVGEWAYDVHGARASPLRQRRAVERICGWAGESIARELCSHLAGAGAAAVVATSFLGLVPWHAATWRGAMSDEHYALETLRFTYTPHARALRAAQTSASECLTPALVVADPRPVSATHLPGAAAEATLVAEAFSGCAVLVGEQARLEAVREALRPSAVAHFACHGKADLNEPLQSALLLAHDERLPLIDLLRDRLGASRLTVLSACQTNLPGLHLPDETTTLATGLFFAGSRAVIGSLWTVPDAATTELMTRFYGRWPRANADAAAALRDAQLSFLELPSSAEEPEPSRWSSPYYWGAFIHVGA